jgi:transcriptional regulator with XRE-family HTH domain
MIDRIQLLLKTMNLSPSQFADEIQVQRSSISHILSGRNKPSLDFVLKILSTYPEINSEWLMFGKNKMMKETKIEKEIMESEKHDIVQKEKIKKEEPKSTPDPTLPLFDPEEEKNQGEIEKMVIFYKDGTFKEYSPK